MPASRSTCVIRCVVIPPLVWSCLAVACSAAGPAGTSIETPRVAPPPVDLAPGEPAVPSSALEEIARLVKADGAVRIDAAGARCVAQGMLDAYGDTEALRRARSNEWNATGQDLAIVIGCARREPTVRELLAPIITEALSEISSEVALSEKDRACLGEVFIGIDLDALRQLETLESDRVGRLFVPGFLTCGRESFVPSMLADGLEKELGSRRNAECFARALIAGMSAKELEDLILDQAAPPPPRAEVAALLEKCLEPE